jgi:quercetin dioxygenase-like cupin family protein
VTGERMTVARIYLKDGFLVPMHSHVHEQITQIISGRMRFTFGEDRSEVVEYGPGDVIVIPSNLPHEALSIGDVEEMDMWSPRWHRRLPARVISSNRYNSGGSATVHLFFSPR